jgi:tetratricopeptide (TPR) repeat protein
MRRIPLILLALSLVAASSGRAQSDSDETLRQWLSEGNAAVQAGQFDAAIARFQQVLDKLEPDSASAGDLYLRLGETNRRKGDFESSIRCLSRANELLPGNATVIGTLALALDSAGNRPEALRAYRATLEIDADNAVAMNNLAFLLAEGGSELDEALQLATRAMALAPDSGQTIDTAGWVRLKRGENDAAIALFSQAVAKDPSDEDFRNHLLMALERKGDHTGILGETISTLKQVVSPDNVSKLTTLIQGLK